MKLRKPYSSPSRPKHQDGFLLLGVLVMLVLILIALAVAAPKIAESIRRDKEIETVHRGMQYARAIQVYYNKFGRYPTSIDQLVKTDNQRFLRKRYLNPMTGKDDWRIIHYGEQRVPAMGLFGQAVQQQAGMMPGVNNGTTASNGPGGSSSPFGSSGIGASGIGASGIGGNNSPVNSSPSGSSSGGFPEYGTTPQTLTFTGDSSTDTANSGPSTPTTGSNTGGGIGSSGVIGSGGGIGSTGSSTNSGTSSGFGSSSNFGGTTSPGGMGSTQIGGTQTTGGSNSAFGTPGVSVGAPIIGVGLLSKKTSIKIYKKQTHYNQWEFIYDPNQNVMAAAGGVGGGANGTSVNGGSASSFGSGSGSGFGSNNGSGFGSNNGPGFGSNNGSGFGSNNGSGFGSSNGPGFGSSGGPGSGSNNGSTFGSSPTSPSPSSPTNNSPQ